MARGRDCEFFFASRDQDRLKSATGEDLIALEIYCLIFLSLSAGALRPFKGISHAHDSAFLLFFFFFFIFSFPGR